MRSAAQQVVGVQVDVAVAEEVGRVGDAVVVVEVGPATDGVAARIACILPGHVAPHVEPREEAGIHAALHARDTCPADVFVSHIHRAVHHFDHVR